MLYELAYYIYGQIFHMHLGRMSILLPLDGIFCIHLLFPVDLKYVLSPMWPADFLSRWPINCWKLYIEVPLYYHIPYYYHIILLSIYFICTFRSVIFCLIYLGDLMHIYLWLSYLLDELALLLLYNDHLYFLLLFWFRGFFSDTTIATLTLFCHSLHFEPMYVLRA